MNALERAAYKAGVEAVCQMALTTAATIDVRKDAREVRQQADVATSRRAYSRVAGT